MKLNEALKAGQYDIVLTDLADAASIQSEIESSPSKPVLLPLAYKLTKAEAAAAQKQYKYLVKHPSSGDEYLEAIYEITKSKAQKPGRKA